MERDDIGVFSNGHFMEAVNMFEEANFESCSKLCDFGEHLACRFSNGCIRIGEMDPFICTKE